MGHERSATGEIRSVPVVEPVSVTSSLGDLIRHQVATSVLAILVNDPGVRLGEDPGAVHRYRVAARRLRSDLRTFRSGLDRASEEAVRDELRWLGGVIGPVRDLDVLGARIADHARMLSDCDRAGAAVVLERLATERAEAGASVIDALGSERYERLLDTLLDFASHPPLSARSRNPRRTAALMARHLVRRRWEQLHAEVEAGGNDPSDNVMHRIRISAKRCRYAAEAVAPVVGRPARRFAGRVERVQGVLGDHHDTVVAEAWLRSAAVADVEVRVAVGSLIAIERAERARLRAEWLDAWHRASKRKVRAWF